jgi:hypothetical protein
VSTRRWRACSSSRPLQGHEDRSSCPCSRPGACGSPACCGGDAADSGGARAEGAEGVAARLAALGFADADAEAALAAAGGAAGGAVLEACLDWLCMHVPEADLPPAFAPGAAAQRTGCAGATVLQRVCGPAGRPRAAVGPPTFRSPPPRRQRAAHALGAWSRAGAAGRPVGVLHSGLRARPAAPGAAKPSDVAELAAFGYPPAAAAGALAACGSDVDAALVRLFRGLNGGAAAAGAPRREEPGRHACAHRSCGAMREVTCVCLQHPGSHRAHHRRARRRRGRARRRGARAGRGRVGGGAPGARRDLRRRRGLPVGAPHGAAPGGRPDAGRAAAARLRLPRAAARAGPEARRPSAGGCTAAGAAGSAAPADAMCPHSAVRPRPARPGPAAARSQLACYAMAARLDRAAWSPKQTGRGRRAVALRHLCE